MANGCARRARFGGRVAAELEHATQDQAGLFHVVDDEDRRYHRAGLHLGDTGRYRFVRPLREHRSAPRRRHDAAWQIRSELGAEARHPTRGGARPSARASDRRGRADRTAHLRARGDRAAPRAENPSRCVQRPDAPMTRCHGTVLSDAPLSAASAVPTARAAARLSEDRRDLAVRDDLAARHAATQTIDETPERRHRRHVGASSCPFCSLARPDDASPVAVARMSCQQGAGKRFASSSAPCLCS